MRIHKHTLVLALIVFASCSKSTDDNPEINVPPSAPFLMMPDDGSLCSTIPLDFLWETSTDSDNDDIIYEIEIARDGQFLDIVEKKSYDQTSALFSLEKGILYYWRVRAKDSKNEYSDYSPTWKFYTEGEGTTNYLPFPPTLIEPNLNTFVQETSVNLQWISSDVDRHNRLTYDLYFGLSNPPDLLKENLQDPKYTVNIVEGKTYYWKIIVKDDMGGKITGQVWVFKS